MITFKYKPTLVPHNEALTTNVYAVIFSDHYKWLVENDIEYSVNLFTWPEMLSNLANRQLGMSVCEFEVTIEDEKQAIRFRLYTDMAPELPIF